MAIEVVKMINELEAIFADPRRRFCLMLFGGIAEGLGIYSRDRENQELLRILGRFPSEYERWFYRWCQCLRDAERAQREIEYDQREAKKGIERISKAVLGGD